jgi:hypothetical protein
MEYVPYFWASKSNPINDRVRFFERLQGRRLNDFDRWYIRRLTESTWNHVVYTSKQYNRPNSGLPRAGRGSGGRRSTKRYRAKRGAAIELRRREARREEKRNAFQESFVPSLPQTYVSWDTGEIRPVQHGRVPSYGGMQAFSESLSISDRRKHDEYVMKEKLSFLPDDIIRLLEVEEKSQSNYEIDRKLGRKRFGAEYFEKRSDEGSKILSARNDIRTPETNVSGCNWTKFNSWGKCPIHQFNELDQVTQAWYSPEKLSGEKCPK